MTHCLAASLSKYAMPNFTPLPFRGGVGGGASPQALMFVDTPHPNPFPEGEGR